MRFVYGGGRRVLQNYDGFEISGSPHDAYANGSWILGLHFLLQTLDAMEKKLLGIVLDIK